MKRLVALMAILFFSSVAMAQEQIVSYDENSLPVLNEELRRASVETRKNNDSVASLQKKFDALSDVVSNISDALGLTTSDSGKVTVASGVFSRASNAGSGSVSVTGVGFMPSVVIFSAGSVEPQVITSGGGWMLNDGVIGGVGFDNGTWKYNPITSTSSYSCVFFAYDSDIGDTTPTKEYQLGYISALTEDGFTVSFTQSGSNSAAGTANITWMAFK